MKRGLLTVIIPVYNEQEVLPQTYQRLSAAIAGIQMNYEMIFVNDGSSDATAQMLGALAERDKHIRVINFSRNFGHQIAITAGMDHAEGEAVVVIDADLQDPPEIIAEMVKKWREGYEVVYGKREKREGESFFKLFTSSAYYRILNAMTDTPMPVDVGDFRLIDYKVCDALKKLPERSRYVRGLISWLGFRQSEVIYARAARAAGTTKYPLRKMLKLAADGIMSFSNKPLRMAAFAGAFVSCLAFLYMLYVIWLAIFTDQTTTGWASSIAVTLFLNGIVLMVLGIMGSYIGRIYEEVKGRPLYIVGSTRGFEDER